MTNDAELEAQIRARDTEDYETGLDVAGWDRRALLRLLDEARGENERLIAASDAASGARMRIGNIIQERDELRAELADTAARLAKADAEIERLTKLANDVRDKLAEYLQLLLQGRDLPNRWVGEINDIVGAALSPAPPSETP